MTKSSVNFKMVKSAWQAVSHSSREVAPSYLLDPAASMGTIVILDDAGKVASTLEAKLALASRQALREKNFSPVWEGVLNLPRPEAGFNPDQYKKTCADIVSNWCKSYENSTGHKVLRADIHLDEGHMVDGEVVLNAHAHVIADRTNDKGRVMQLSPKMLRDLQTLTAEVTGLERGESSRKTGRKHISHQAYKYLAEQGRLETQQLVGDVKSQLGKSQKDLSRLQNMSREWSDADLEKIKKLQAHIDSEPERLVAALAAQKAQLDEQYRLDRAALKASGDATQADYQQLKKDHEKAVADLAKAQAKLTTFQADLDGEPERLATALVAQKAHLDEQYRLEKEALETKYKAERVEYKASTEKKTQQDYKDLKAVHLSELDALAKSHASDLADLQTNLAEAQSKADLVPDLQAGATKAQAEIDRLTTVAAQVQQLETKLAEAQSKADLVPELEATITSQATAFGSLKGEAMDVITPLRKEVKTMKTQINQIQGENERLEAIERITLKKLEVDFGVDIRPAAKLQGTALREWTQAAEDRVMAQLLAEREAEKVRFAEMAAEYQKHKAEGKDPALFLPAPAQSRPLRPAAVPESPQEAKKSITHPAPLPTPEKSLLERLEASMQAMLVWIKEVGGKNAGIDASVNNSHLGPIKHLDELHAVQHKGRGQYAVHRLADLDGVPALDDPATEISYSGGFGHVTGGRGGRGGLGD